MEEETNFNGPCSSLAVNSILRAGTAGFIWGFCASPYDAKQMGINGIPRALFVGKSVAKFGFQCGLIAGIFSISRCGLQRYRRKNDWVNSSVAGAVAGATVAARTRCWKQILGMASLVSIFSSVADYYKEI